jgi:ATP-dependent RNA helicase DDX49/DBP8
MSSDSEFEAHQDGSRKRRKLTPDDETSDVETAPKPTVSTISRVQIKKKIDSSNGGAKAAPAATIPTEKTATFGSINVSPWLIASLSAMEIKRPTGIQKACIPEILKGRDCIGGSRTGTGKTMAFAVPILQQWAKDPMGIYGVVIT